MNETTHELKTLSPYFQYVWDGTKNFELRRDDREFQPGDGLLLVEHDPATGDTGRRAMRRILYVLRDVPEFGLQDGFAILGFRAEDAGWNFFQADA